jgi:hypothetical protein
MRALLLALGALLAGCVDNVDHASNVHDLRVLAMRADPPDFIVSDLGSGALPALPSFTVQSLIYDPPQGHRDIHFSYSTCPSPVNERCEGVDGEIAMTEGTVTGGIALGTLGATAEQLSQFATLFTTALADDPYHGFGGLPLTMALHATASTDEIWGAKEIVIWLPIPKAIDGQQPNKNPPPPDLMIDGVVVLVGDKPLVRDGTPFDVFPPDPSLKESYLVPNFDGTIRALTESWSYSWFTTKGRFSSESTGGWNQIFQADNDTPTTIELGGETPGDFEVIVVVRDGRGGESWVIRQATYQGP